MDPKRLRERAWHFRQMARQINDDQAQTKLIELATNYEKQADAIERRQAAKSPGTTAAQSQGAVPRGGT